MSNIKRYEIKSVIELTDKPSGDRTKHHAKLEQVNKIMREALETMSDKRAMTIFIQDENHVANFFKVADEAINQVKEKDE